MIASRYFSPKALHGRWVFLVAALLLFWQVRTVLLLVFAGVLVAILLRSLSETAAKRLHIPARWSLPAVFIAITGTLILAVWLRGSAMATEFTHMWERLPGAAHQLVVWLQQEEWGRWLLARVTAAAATSGGSTMFSQATRALSITVATMAGGLIALVIGVYLAAEPSIYVRGILRLSPAAQRAKVSEIIADLGRQLRWWLIARFISMIAVGAIIATGLTLLGVPLAGPLGGLAGLLTFVPNIGPVLSAIPSVLLAFSLAPQKAVAVILLFIGTHILEGLLITPLLERRAVSLPPALTLSTQLMLALWVGPLGVMLAAPVVLAAVVLVRHMAPGDEPEGAVAASTVAMVDGRRSLVAR